LATRIAEGPKLGHLRTTAKRPTAEMIAEGLTVPERIMLACIAFLPRLQRAAVAPSLTRQLFVRGLIDRQEDGRYVLTAEGRRVLEALMMRAATRGWPHGFVAR
jgi:predicted transcriptional regulator